MSIGQTPNHAKFCGGPTRSVRDIRDQKFVLPERVGKKSPKSLKTCYPLKPLHIMPNFIQIGETTLEKIVTSFFTPFNILVSQGGPPGLEVTGLGSRVHQLPSSIATCKYSSRFDDPFPRYLLPNFIDFVAGVTHKQTRTKNIQ